MIKHSDLQRGIRSAVASLFVAVAFSLMPGSGFTDSLYAQCGGGCNDGGANGAYQNVVGGEFRDCSSSEVWDDDFFGCCDRSIFRFRVCDPCCSRPYVSVFGGATAVENFHTSVTTSTSPFTVQEDGATLYDGYGAGTSIGYRVHALARLEAEYSYRFNKAESTFTRVTVEGGPDTFTSAIATGRVYSHTGMFNAVFDASPRRVGCFNLYGGGGIGVTTLNAIVNDGANVYTSDDSAFAFQFIGGVNYAMSSRLELFTEYRYMSARNLDVELNGAAFGDFDYDTHNLFMGLRIQL